MLQELSFGKKLENWEDVKKYFKKHKHVLTYLEQYNGFENFFDSSNFKEGHNGRVFKIKGQDKILKVTQDFGEIEKASKLEGKTFKHLINIYDVVTIYEDLAIIEAEFLYPPTGDVKIAMKHYHKISAFFGYDDYNYLDGFSEELKRQIYAAYKELIKAKIDPFIVDVWKNNIMQDREGNLKLIDI